MRWIYQNGKTCYLILTNQDFKNKIFWRKIPNCKQNKTKHNTKDICYKRTWKVLRINGIDKWSLILCKNLCPVTQGLTQIWLTSDPVLWPRISWSAPSYKRSIPVSILLGLVRSLQSWKSPNNLMKTLERYWNKDSCNPRTV